MEKSPSNPSKNLIKKMISNIEKDSLRKKEEYCKELIGAGNGAFNLGDKKEAQDILENLKDTIEKIGRQRTPSEEALIVTLEKWCCSPGD